MDIGADEFAFTCPGDVNDDGVVNVGDLAAVINNLGLSTTDGNASGDIDFDREITVRDLLVVIEQLGVVCP